MPRKTLKAKGYQLSSVSRNAMESPAKVTKVVNKYGFYMNKGVRKSFKKELKKGVY